jgi:hypothetical protein
MLIGALHGVVQDSTLEQLTMSGILFHFSSYWSEGAPSSDVAIRNNKFIGTDWSRKFYQYGTSMGTYPHRNAAISIVSEVATNFNKTPDNFNGIYPAFQDIEISGNTIQSLSGPGLYIAGVENTRTPGSTAGIFRNHFTSCPAVPATDPLRPYFGSHSTSAVDLSFAHGITLAGNQTHPTCAARVDFSSSSEITDQAR